MLRDDFSERINRVIRGFAVYTSILGQRCHMFRPFPFSAVCSPKWYLVSGANGVSPPPNALFSSYVLFDLSEAQACIWFSTLFTGHCVGISWRNWLRHCATSQKVVVSIPDGVIGIFHWRNPYGHTMALGLTQPVTEMSTRSISWRVKEAGA